MKRKIKAIFEDNFELVLSELEGEIISNLQKAIKTIKLLEKYGLTVYCPNDLPNDIKMITFAQIYDGIDFSESTRGDCILIDYPGHLKYKDGADIEVFHLSGKDIRKMAEKYKVDEKEIIMNFMRHQNNETIGEMISETLKDLGIRDGKL